MIREILSPETGLAFEAMRELRSHLRDQPQFVRWSARCNDPRAIDSSVCSRSRIRALHPLPDSEFASHCDHCPRSGGTRQVTESRAHEHEVVAGERLVAIAADGVLAVQRVRDAVQLIRSRPHRLIVSSGGDANTDRAGERP